MPMLYVNGKRRGLRVKGRARVTPVREKRRASSYGGDDRDALRRGYMGSSKRRGQLARLRAKRAAGVASSRTHRRPHRPSRKGARKGKNGRWVSPKSIAALAAYNRKRGRRARRSTTMAKGSRKRSAAMKAFWRKRKAAGKAGGLGRTKRRKRRSKPATVKRRRARRSHRTKRARPRRQRAATTRRTKRRRRSRRRTKRMGTKTYRGRISQARSLMSGGPNAPTIRMNPSRRRRRRRGSARRMHHARRRRSPRRRTHRRAHRRYRRNPGNALMDLVKSALPVLGGFYATKLIVNKIGPMLPGVSSLGTLQAPVLAIGSVIGLNFITSKVFNRGTPEQASRKTSLMLGAAISALDSLVQAFAPAGVKSLVGMSDYVQMGDYIAVGGAPPLRENFTLSDYIAVGGDGVEQELGLEEELGVEEELGATDGYMGGLPGGARLLAPIPTQSFVTPVPARSFTKAIPAAGTAYDTSSELYGGIFGGRFGS